MLSGPRGRTPSEEIHKVIIAITEGKEDVNKIYIKKINLRLKKYYYNVNVDVIFKK